MKSLNTHITKAQMNEIMPAKVADSLYGLTIRVLNTKILIRTFTKYHKFGQLRVRMSDSNAYKINDILKLLNQRRQGYKIPLWDKERKLIKTRLKEFKSGEHNHKFMTNEEYQEYLVN